MSTIKYGLNCKKAYYDGGAVDGCDCKETLRLIAEGGPDAELLITHTYPPERIEMGNLLLRTFEYFKDSIIQTETQFFLPVFAFNIEKTVQPRKKVRTGLNLFKLNAS